MTFVNCDTFKKTIKELRKELQPQEFECCDVNVESPLEGNGKDKPIKLKTGDNVTVENGKLTVKIPVINTDLPLKGDGVTSNISLNVGDGLEVRNGKLHAIAQSSGLDCDSISSLPVVSYESNVKVLGKKDDECVLVEGLGGIFGYKDVSVSCSSSVYAITQGGEFTVVVAVTNLSKDEQSGSGTINYSSDLTLKSVSGNLSVVDNKFTFSNLQSKQTIKATLTFTSEAVGSYTILSVLDDEDFVSENNSSNCIVYVTKKTSTKGLTEYKGCKAVNLKYKGKFLERLDIENNVYNPNGIEETGEIELDVECDEEPIVHFAYTSFSRYDKIEVLDDRVIPYIYPFLSKDYLYPSYVHSGNYDELTYDATNRKIKISSNVGNCLILVRSKNTCYWEGYIISKALKTTTNDIVESVVGASNVIKSIDVLSFRNYNWTPSEYYVENANRFYDVSKYNSYEGISYIQSVDTPTIQTRTTIYANKNSTVKIVFNANITVATLQGAIETNYNTITKTYTVKINNAESQTLALQEFVDLVII